MTIEHINAPETGCTPEEQAAWHAGIEAGREIERNNIAAPAQPAAAEAAQSALAGEREAFEAWARRPDNGTGKLDLRLCDIGLYYRRETGTAWDGFKAGAAWQRTQSAGVPEDLRAAMLAVIDRSDWRTAANRAELRALLAAAPAHPAGRQEQGEVRRLREALHAAAEYIGDRSAGSSAFWDLYDAAMAATKGESNE